MRWNHQKSEFHQRIKKIASILHPREKSRNILENKARRKFESRSFGTQQNGEMMK